MPKARNPNRDKARDMWLLNTKMPLKDIAAELHEAEGTIRKWKSVDKWEQEKRNAPKKRGAPKGNRNAKGHAPSVPLGNQNAVKHGGYSKVFLDVLSDEERSYIEDMPQDDEILIIDQIKVLLIREVRLLKAIKKYQTEAGKEESPVTQVTQGITTIENKKVFASTDDKRRYLEIVRQKQDEDKISYFYDTVTVTRTTEAVHDIVRRLEQELTSVQRSKAKAIDTLHKIRFDRAKMNEANTKNEVVDDWVLSLTGDTDE